MSSLETNSQCEQEKIVQIELFQSHHARSITSASSIHHGLVYYRRAYLRLSRNAQATAHLHTATGIQPLLLESRTRRTAARCSPETECTCGLRRIACSEPGPYQTFMEQPEPAARRSAKHLRYALPLPHLLAVGCEHHRSRGPSWGCSSRSEAVCSYTRSPTTCTPGSRAGNAAATMSGTTVFPVLMSFLIHRAPFQPPQARLRLDSSRASSASCIDIDA